MTSVPAEKRELIEGDPFCTWLGIEVVELEPGYAKLELTLTESMCNFHGVPHGGVIYALADASFAAAGNSREHVEIAIETNMSYLAATDPDTTLIGIAEETHTSQRTAAYSVSVRDDTGELVASFRGRSYKPEVE